METSKPESIPRRRKLAGHGNQQASEYTPLKEIGGAGEQARQRIYPAEGNRQEKGEISLRKTDYKV